jgi:hypothetical protein
VREQYVRVKASFHKDLSKSWHFWYDHGKIVTRDCVKNFQDQDR